MLSEQTWCGSGWEAERWLTAASLCGVAGEKWLSEKQWIFGVLFISRQQHVEPVRLPFHLLPKWVWGLESAVYPLHSPWQRNHLKLTAEETQLKSTLGVSLLWPSASHLQTSALTLNSNMTNTKVSSCTSCAILQHLVIEAHVSDSDTRDCLPVWPRLLNGTTPTSCLLFLIISWLLSPVPALLPLISTHLHPLGPYVHAAEPNLPHHLLCFHICISFTPFCHVLCSVGLVSC